MAAAAAVVAPKPQEPSPVEIQSWHGARANARQQYLNQMAQSAYGRATAGTNLGVQQRQLAYNQNLGRQSFDDPYIGRGIFNSGIRGQGLQNFYTAGANEMSNAQQAYLNQMGQYTANDLASQGSYDTTMRNLLAAENARRNQLATEIKAVV